MDVNWCIKNLEKLVNYDFVEVSEMVKDVEANQKLQEMKGVMAAVLGMIKSLKMENGGDTETAEQEVENQNENPEDDRSSSQPSLGTSSLASTRRTQDVNFQMAVEENGPSQKNEGEQPRWQLHWESRQEMNMPFGMTRNIQVVVLNQVLYVGGGNAERDVLENEFKVMSYNLASQQWKVIPYIARWFAMVNVDDKLTLVGGQDKYKEDINFLRVWNQDEWKSPYSPMPTCRHKCSAAVYKRYIVVAGGTTNKILPLSTVEVLNLNDNQWHQVNNPPITPFDSMKSVIQDDTWYLMGGCIGKPVQLSVFAIQLNELVTDRESTSTWTELPKLPCYYSSPVLVGKELLAVGGSKNEPQILDTIYLYDHNESRWVLAAKQPCAINNCACTVISNTMYIIGGWDGKIRRTSVHTCLLDEGQFCI